MKEEDLVYMNRDKADASCKLANNAVKTYNRLKPIRDGSIDLSNVSMTEEEWKQEIKFLIEFLIDEIKANNEAMQMLSKSGIIFSSYAKTKPVTEGNILPFPPKKDT